MITERLIDCNNFLGISQAVIAVAQYGMETKDIRVIRLRNLIDDKYDGYDWQFAFVKRHVEQYFHHRFSIGSPMVIAGSFL